MIRTAGTLPGVDCDVLRGVARDDRGFVHLGWAPRPALDGRPPHPDAGHVVTLAHLSDLHVCDAESPARLEHLDRHGLPGAPYRRVLGDIGTYRPQEVLTVPVAVAMVEAVNALQVGPVAGRPVDACVLTGDLVDNAQANELAWYLAVVEGGAVRPASGDPRRSGWVGAADVAWSDAVWHPEGHRSGRRDQWTDRWGFPQVPDLLDAARSEFRSPGLSPRWFAVHGNHDLLLQGTVPADDRTAGLAVGSRRMLGLHEGQTPLAVLEATARIGPARYLHDDRTRWEPVAADPHRRLLPSGAFAEAHRSRTPGDRRDGPGRAYTAVAARDVRLIALDTVNPWGGWEGSLDRGQFHWLRAVLAASTEPYVVVASHHPSWCLVNPYHPHGAEPRVLADDLLTVLLDEPRVVLWLSGHVHHHAHTLHRRGSRVLPEITSASCIDWPQQSRVLEVLREPSGELAIVSTALDHTGPARPGDHTGPAGSAGPVPHHRTLASWSRALAHNAPLLAGTIARAEAAGAVEVDTVVRVPDPHGDGRRH